MGLTKDDVLKETTSNPALKDELFSSFKDDFLAGLKAEGVIIRSPEEETKFIQNYEKSVIPGKVKEFEKKLGELHTKFEEDIYESSGIEKNVNEKSFEYLKRAITALKGKQKNGNDDPVLADKLKDLEKKLAERQDWVPKEKLTEVEQRYFGENVNNRIASVLDKRPIAIPAHITDDKAKQQYAQAQRDMLRQSFLNKFTAKKDEDGNIVYYEGDKIQLNPQGAPSTEDELISKHYTAHFVPETKPKTGAGSGKGGERTKDVNEASLKTKAEVLDYLKKKFEPQGIKKGSKQFNDEYTRIITDYGITE